MTKVKFTSVILSDSINHHIVIPTEARQGAVEESEIISDPSTSSFAKASEDKTLGMTIH